MQRAKDAIMIYVLPALKKMNHFFESVSILHFYSFNVLLGFCIRDVFPMGVFVVFIYGISLMSSQLNTEPLPDCLKVMLFCTNIRDVPTVRQKLSMPFDGRWIDSSQ